MNLGHNESWYHSMFGAGMTGVSLIFGVRQEQHSGIFAILCTSVISTGRHGLTTMIGYD